MRSGCLIRGFVRQDEVARVTDLVGTERVHVIGVRSPGTLTPHHVEAWEPSRTDELSAKSPTMVVDMTQCEAVRIMMALDVSPDAWERLPAACGLLLRQGGR